MKNDDRKLLLLALVLVMGLGVYAVSSYRAVHLPPDEWEAYGSWDNESGQGGWEKSRRDGRVRQVFKSYDSVTYTYLKTETKMLGGPP